MALHLIGGDDLPTVVFSNALGTSRDVWREQVAALRDRFRLVLYDHPPLDSVEALGGDLLRQLRELEIERFSFCGLSLGAMVGMELAASHPDRIEKLVLCCTSARFGEPFEWRDRAAFVRREGMRAVAADALDRWFTSDFADRDRFLEMQLAMPPEDYARGLEAIGGFDFRGRLAEIVAPTLVVSGAQDEATPPSDGRFIADHIRNAHFVVLPDAAHIANVEQPRVFNAVLEEHLSA